MTEPPLAFRIVNWIGIIDQLTTTEGNRLLKPLGLPLPQLVMLNHFSHRPDEARTVTSIARALQQPQPGVTKNVQNLVAKGWLRERSQRRRRPLQAPGADAGRVGQAPRRRGGADAVDCPRLCRLVGEGPAHAVCAARPAQTVVRLRPGSDLIEPR